MDLNRLFERVTQWALQRSDIRAAALTDEDWCARPRANLAMMVVTAESAKYSADLSWTTELGSIVDATVMPATAITVRIALHDGASIDFVFVPPSWLKDEHGWRKLKGGLVPIIDRYGEIAAWHKAVETNDPQPQLLANLTYEEWLGLSREEQDDVRATWNPYKHDNIHLPQEAARRFFEQCKYPCAGVSVGVYHMGQYVISASLYASRMSQEEIAALPRWLTFEGFSVQYLREPE
jgi:hypothetical protein